MALKSILERAEALFFDPRLYALLLFLSGLYWLDMPYYGDHAPRQTGTATIARNFYEYGLNPFFPTSNICGDASPDYFATEFPLLQTLTTLLYYVFGEQYWAGRLINWTVSCVGLVYFARLMDGVTARKVGLFAAMIMTGSIVTVFMRKMMPDTFSLFLTIIGTFWLFRYLEAGRRRDVLLGGLFVTLGVLCKIPSLMVLCFLSVPFLTKAVPPRRKIEAGVAIGVAGLFTAGWYFAWMPYLQSITKCPPLIFPVSLAEGYQFFFFELWEQTKHKFLLIAFFGPWPFWLFLVGFLVTVWRREWQFLPGAAAYATLSLLFAFKTGPVFPTHTYYIIPLIPLMACFVALLVDWPKRWRWAALAVVLLMVFEPVRKTRRDLYLNADPVEKLAETLDGIGIARDDLIMVTNRGIDPTLMFYARRRGWAVNNDVLYKYHWMPDYRDRHLKYIVTDRRRFRDTLDYPRIYRDSLFDVYDVRGTEPAGKIR